MVGRCGRVCEGMVWYGMEWSLTILLLQALHGGEAAGFDLREILHDPPRPALRHSGTWTIFLDFSVSLFSLSQEKVFQSQMFTFPAGRYYAFFNKRMHFVNFFRHDSSVFLNIDTQIL